MRSFIHENGRWVNRLFGPLLSFFASRGEERQLHNCLRTDDQQRGNTLIAVRLASPCDDGPESFAHEAHDVVFDLDDRWSSKRGGPISRRS